MIWNTGKIKMKCVNLNRKITNKNRIIKKEMGMKNKKIVLVTLIEAMILSCSSGNYKGEGNRVKEGNPEDFLVPVIPGKPGNTSIPPNTTSTINPDIPGGPYTPSNPNIPETPINPITPGNPSFPLNPSVPVAPLNPGTPITPVIPAPVYKLKEDSERFRIAFTDNPDIFTVHIPEANLPSDREVKDSITTSETDEGHIGIKIESEVDSVTGAHRPSYEKTLFLYSDIQMKGKKFHRNIYKSGKEQRMGAIVHQGEINSSASNVVGIFTDSGSDKKIFMNEGSINLSGDKSVGMYGTGGGGYELKNLGDIIIGDSSNRNNPSIGMYSANGSTRLLNNSGRRNMGIRVEEKILNRYNKSFKGGSIKEIKIASDALLWNTESETDGDEIKSVLLKKKSYTEFAENEKEKLIAQGLDQRYGVNTYDSEEKQLFNSLNTLSNNQKELLSKTYKEVSGSQYINVQQRLKETGEILDDEIKNLEDYLHIEGLEDSNKISTFVTEGKYSTKTDEIPDYRTKGFGVVYLHNRNIDKWGWYVAAGINNFKLKGNGKSEEEILMLKAGGYKMIDLANEVKWTVSGRRICCKK